MSVSGFGDSKTILITTARVFSWRKPDERGKVLCGSKPFEVSDLCKYCQCGHSFDTDKTRQLANVLLIGFICCEFFNAFVEPFQLVGAA